jgi:hypothetical protein
MKRNISFKNRISGNGKYTEDYTTSLYIIEFICLVWYNSGFGWKHICEEEYIIFFEKNTIPFILLGANNLLYISYYSLI